MTTTIKRYPNRKLYNTETKRYITLDGIASLIRKGEDVDVIDHTTGEDLTSLTLSQIIFEQEKKKSGFLPQSVLTGLIQAGGETIQSLRRTVGSPLDMLRHIDEEIERRVSELIERGELARDEGARMLEKLVGRANAEEDLEALLQQHGVPTNDQVEQIRTQLDELTAKLEEIERSSQA